MSAHRSQVQERVVRYPDHLARRYRESGAWQGVTIGESLHQAALRYAGKEAVVSPERRLTYEQLDHESDQFAAALLRRGLEPEDRVLFQMGNTVETVVAYYGTVKAGLIPVCTIPQHGKLEMEYLARHSWARAHLVQADYRSQDLRQLAGRVSAASPGLTLTVVARGDPGDGVSFEELVGAEDPGESRRTVEALELDAGSVGVFQLSGGTTGVPKIVPRLHCEYVYNAQQWARANGFDENTVVMHPIPLLHNAGTIGALQSSHYAGAKLVVSPDPSPETMLSLIENERVNVLPVVMPALLIRLLDHEDRESYDIGSLRRVQIGGQKLLPELANRMESELGIRCTQMFGMAEGMCLRTPDDAPEWVRKHTIGTPISPLDEIRLLDPLSEDEVPPGDVGELCCRGPYTIHGYYDTPERNASAFTSDGFYRTGDVALAHTVGGEVYYSVEGRIKDLVNRGAEKISAEEVEGLLVEYPAIRNAVLVAMPDPELGERPCAYVSVRAGFDVPTLEDLKDFLLGRGLTKFKLPERLEILEELPMTNVEKVSKKELREDITSKLKEEGAWTPEC